MHRPFLRWAGGKQWLVATLGQILPREFGHYFEPFLGGGSVFLALAPAVSSLSDVNSRLIETYRSVRDNPRRVLYWLAQWPNSPEQYRQLRKAEFSSPNRRAAQFIYLNKTCWNGLYRVNKQGEFNVPYAHDPTRQTHDVEAILAASSLLGSATLECCDFEDMLAAAGAGDLVYLDPPYTVMHANNGFVRYNERLFTWDDQLRLASVARRLASGDCHVVVTNAYHPDVIGLYQGFTAISLDRRSLLAADPRSRRPVHEALLVSHSVLSEAASHPG